MNFFAARQPILNADKSLFAYELLFRDSPRNSFPDVAPDVATSRIVDGLQSIFEIESLTNNKLAFVNFTDDCIISQLPQVLPKENLVVEVLETAKPTKRLLEAVKTLKNKGYKIALDDYAHAPVWKHFFPYVDFIKVETPITPPDQLTAFCEDVAAYPHITLLAEKIETHEQYDQAKELGFTLFQGYFFSRPEVVSSHTIDHARQTLLQLVADINQPEYPLDDVVKAFEQNVNLSVKLLRYVNSAVFRRVSEVSSIRQAVVLLGTEEVRRFVMLLFAASDDSNQTSPLSMMALVRAKFCENCFADHKDNELRDRAFFTGLMSVVDAMFDRPLKEIIESLGVSKVVADALIEGKGEIGAALTLVKQIEKADWRAANTQQKEIRLSDEKAQESYMEAIRWANERLAIFAD